MVTSHTNLGQTVQETDTLQDEHKKFEAAASVSYRKNSKIWDTSNNCHNCPKNRKV